MKKHGKTTVITGIIILAISQILSSCVVAYSVHSDVMPDGSMVKTVWTKADSACLAGDFSKHPFLFDPTDWEMSVTEHTDTFDFIGDEFIHNFMAVRKYLRPTGTTEPPASTETANQPYVKGKEEWNVKRGLFANRYFYCHTFPGIAGDMPISIADYLTEEELELWLESGHFKDYVFMNGVEMYSNMLSGYFVNFQKWIYDCAIEIRYRIIAEYTGDTITSAQKEKLFSIMGKEREVDYDDILPSLPDLGAIAEAMSAISGNPAFMTSARQKMKELENILSATESELMNPFHVVYRYEVGLPGKLVSANTSMSQDGHPVWKVDGYRLLAGDMILYAKSVRINAWSFILLGTLAAAAAIALYIRRR